MDTRGSTIAKPARETAKKQRSSSSRSELRRPGLDFYALRHTFETFGGETADQVAVDAIMAHAPASNEMAAAYRERISDKRLKAVTESVRTWLLPRKRKAK